MENSIYGDLSWLDNYENIWQVGMWLAEDKLGWDWAKNNLAYYFEKPYKYTDEYLEWRKYMDWEMSDLPTDKCNGYYCWLEEQAQWRIIEKELGINEKKLSIEELSDN